MSAKASVCVRAGRVRASPTHALRKDESWRTTRELTFRAHEQMVRDLPVSVGEVSDEELHGVVRSLADEAGQVNMRALARALDTR